MSASRSPATSRAERAPCAPSLVWYFGYGSLMWNPGFAHEAFEPAAARRLEPGLVRLLDPLSRHGRPTGPRARACSRGGSAASAGRSAWRPSARPRSRPISTPASCWTSMSTSACGCRCGCSSGDGEVDAWCYVARPEHEHYAGDLDADAVLRLRPAGPRPRRRLRRLCPQHGGPPARDADRRARPRADRPSARRPSRPWPRASRLWNAAGCSACGQCPASGTVASRSCGTVPPQRRSPAAST